MKKTADLHYQGEVFTVITEGAFFEVRHGGGMVGCGFWDASADRLRWQEQPRETPAMPCDSGTLRALALVALENMQPFCASCCEGIKVTGTEYCWPCTSSFREESALA